VNKQELWERQQEMLNRPTRRVPRQPRDPADEEPILKGETENEERIPTA
jgi:hypothetical protein